MPKNIHHPKPPNDGLDELYELIQRPEADKNFQDLMRNPPEVKDEHVFGTRPKAPRKPDSED